MQALAKSYFCKKNSDIGQCDMNAQLRNVRHFPEFFDEQEVADIGKMSLCWRLKIH